MSGGTSARNLRRQAGLALNRLRFSVRLEMVNGKRKLVIHETHQRAIKWMRHGVTVVGLLSAFIVFQSVFVALCFGVLLHFITLGLERTAFSYRTMYVFPLPAFSLPLSEWLGMAFGWASSPGMDGRIALMAMQVADTGCAQRLSDLFWRWIEDDPNNEADRVQASVVFLDDTHYRFFLYPKFSSPEMEERYAELECQAAPTSLKDVHDQMLVMCVLKQDCTILPTSTLPDFIEHYSPQVPVLFEIQVPGSSEPAPGTKSFTIRSLKFIHADELTRADVEYDFIKLEI